MNKLTPLIPVMVFVTIVSIFCFVMIGYIKHTQREINMSAYRIGCTSVGNTIEYCRERAIAYVNSH